jgi:hypothetical protein
LIRCVLRKIQPREMPASQLPVRPGR